MKAWHGCPKPLKEKDSELDVLRAAPGADVRWLSRSAGPMDRHHLQASAAVMPKTR